MTALKPMEWRKIKGVSATKYRINTECAVPGCTKIVSDKGHHIFPRSQIGNGCFFVTIEDSETYTIPHVIGLCTDHHRDVEAHRAWIKLEDERFVWYDRVVKAPWKDQPLEEKFLMVGPLNPQPGVRAKFTDTVNKPKAVKKMERKRNRRTISYAVPQDEREDGAGVIDDLLSQAKEIHGDVPDYFIYVKALYLLITEGA